MESALRDANVRQGDGATKDIGDVAGALQTAHTLGIRAVRRLQVAARPRREPEDRRGGTTPDVVVLGDEVERTTGMLAGMRKIALRQSEAGTMHGDGSWQTPESLFVDHYRARCAQSQFCIVQASLNLVEVAVRKECPRRRCR